MNLNDWNDDFNQLSSSRVTRTMNFDDNEEPRLAINLEADSQKLAARDDLGINANDVLCGRGKTSFNHVGNRRFRHIISESIDDYNNAGSRKAKSAVVKKVHDNIRATGGRFLKLDSSEREWVELSQQRSLEKVSHAIRDATTTNENMKKKKQKVHNTIAQVAAHVTSRFPGVQLEGSLMSMDGDGDGGGGGDGDTHGGERLAFTSIDDSASSAHNNSNNNLAMPMPPLPGQVASRASIASAPEPATSSSKPSTTAEILESAILDAATMRTSAAAAASRARSSPQQGAVPAFPEHPPLSPQHNQQQQSRNQSPLHEDDFVTYINEVLGPVSPQDLDTDPLQRLARRRR